MGLKTFILGLTFGAAVLIAPQSAQAQSCEAFDNDTGDWEICADYGNGNGTIEHRIKALGGDGYLYGHDEQGGSWFCSKDNSKYAGDWFAGGDCTQVCFDAKLFKDGDQSDFLHSPFKFNFTVRGASSWARFTWTQLLNDNSGQGSDWKTFCAPVKRLKPGEGLPVSADGGWEMGGGSNLPIEDEWNQLFSNVQRVELPIDSVNPVFEEVGYDNICIEGVTCPGEVESSIDKTCTDPIELADGFVSDCTITVNTSQRPNMGDPRYIFVQDELLAPDGTVSADLMGAFSAAGWDCRPNATPFAQGDIPQCFIAEADLPASGEMVINATLTLPKSDIEQTFTNCAILSDVRFPEGAVVDAQGAHDSLGVTLESEWTPVTKILGESCVDLVVPVVSDPPPPPPVPMACTPFTPEVACDTDTGTWRVTLNNALSGTFDPTELSVSSLTNGVTLQSTPDDPLYFGLIGAEPGDTIVVSTEAISEGAGDGEGLDLCCMGEVEITIPAGEQCLPPPPDRDLAITKICAPFDGDDFGSNVECTIFVDYSGPAPTPDNPIRVTDALASGGNMVVQTDWPPAGPDGWRCDPQTPTSGPYTCEMDNSIDTDPTPGYWLNYSTSFSLQMTMDTPYRNCATGTIDASNGSEVSDESCFAAGDFDLVIDKKLADDNSGVCVAGQPCYFEYVVSNSGQDDYVGPITLDDSVLVNGIIPGGDITSISPALCGDVADLTNGAGCNGDVIVPAGGSVTYLVEYQAPILTGSDPAEGQNCVGLTDMTMVPSEHPADVDGQFDCAQFTVAQPEIRVEKSFNEHECSVGGACSFTLTIHNDSTLADYTGPVALRDNDTPGGLQITGMTPPVCTPMPSATPFDCTADVTVPAGGSVAITVDAFMPLGAVPAGSADMMSNCASSAPINQGDIGNWPADLFESTQESCAEVFMCGFACHMSATDAAALTIEKTLLNDAECVPGGTCTYLIAVTNPGTAAVSSPLTLTETLPTGGVLTAVRSLPWSCGAGSGTSTNCAHPPITLAPGDVTSFEVDVAIPAEFARAEIANCAGFLTDSSDMAAAAGIAGARAEGPVGLLMRQGGPNAGDLVQYLQARGLSPEAALRQAAQYVPNPSAASVRTNGAAAQGSGDMSCAVKPVTAPSNKEAVVTPTPTPTPTPQPVPPFVMVEKVCQPLQPNAPYTMTCDLEMSTGNLPAGATLVLTDVLTSVTTGTSTPAELGNIQTSSSHPWTCVPLPGSQGATCFVPTQSVNNSNSVISMTGVANDPASGEDDFRNCVSVTVPGYPDVMAEDCVIFVDGNPVDEDDIVIPQVTLAKSCVVTQASNGTTPHKMTCAIDVTVDQPFNTNFVVHDGLTNAGVRSSRIKSMSAPSGTCTQTPIANDQTPATCSFDGGSFPASLTETITVELEFTPGIDDQLNSTWENCAFGDDMNQSCVDIALPAVVTPPAPLVYSLNKTCDTPVRGYAMTQDGWRSTCTLTLSVISGQGSGMVTMTDGFNPQIGTGMIVDTRPLSAGWQCTITGGAQIAPCSVNAAALTPGSVHQVEVDVFMIDPTGLGGQRAENCVEFPNTPKSCAIIDVPVQAPPVLSVTKTCNDAVRGPNNLHDYSCSIAVSGTNLPPNRMLRLVDMPLTGAEHAHVSFGMNVPGTPLSGCVYDLAGGGTPFDMQLCDVPTNALIAAPGNAMTFTMSGVLDDSLNAVTPPETRNCATLQLVSTDGSSIEAQVGPSCAPINVTPIIDTGSMLDVDYVLRKACQRQAGLGANDLVQCEISVDPAGGAGAKGRYTVTDRWDGDNGGGSGVLQIAGPAGWTCGAAPFGPENPVACSVDAAEFSAAGKPAVLTLVASVPRTMLNAPGMQNCVTGDLDGVAVGEKACHLFTPSKDDVIDTPDAPKLVVEKSLVEACRVNKSARIYECDFALTVRNEGGSVFEGPLVLNDSFGSPKPRDVRTTGQDGWDCLRSDGLGTSCLNGSAVIEPGASSSLTMGLTLPGLARGGSFENCAAIGMGDSDFQRATIVQSVMQRLDIDGGPVDGSPGPKTRQGVRILQERLGLEPTGQIDETLFAALGVPAVDAEAQSCVTAQLPPIPVPVVACKPGQKKNSKGQCYTPEVVCRDGQLKNSKGQCYTPKKDEPRACAAGQKRNSKGQCYTPKKTCPKGQKLNSKNQCYTPRPTCDAKSTVRRGDGCACRYRGMRKVTASRCVCSNGSPIVPGAGCIRIEKKETDGPAAGTEGGKRCVVIGGVRICK